MNNRDIEGFPMDEEQHVTGARTDHHAVAVLPFTCVGDVSEVLYLADGINE